jgi:penicillin G amidase
MAKAGAARRALRIGKWLLIALLALILPAAAYFAWVLHATKPQLEGRVDAPELSAPVTIARDAEGVPVITGAARGDLAFALGYLHGQERFFQMDTLRRLASGELGALFGSSAAGTDKRMRVHRFRARARAAVAAMWPAERALLGAYVAGVNRGREALGAAPFEYALLQGEAKPWHAEDSVLAVFAMYINLQPAVPRLELDRALAAKRGGPALADLLYPQGSALDAPLDGSRLPEVPLPAGLPRMQAPAPRTARLGGEAGVPGSNNWAVAGALTLTGAALVANDMHLGHSVPSIWYRARLVVRPRPGSAEPAADITGVTLPGGPTVVAGSNGRIAWGYTNSYIDTSDAVALEPVPGRRDHYATPEGPKPLRRVTERLCVGDSCEDFAIEETIWGPVIGKDAFGRRIAMRWTAHDLGAVRIAPTLAMERAGSVAEAVAIAHQSGIPQQNLVVGDRSGAIAWTIMGRVPARYGFDGRDVTSFADASMGWRGYLPPQEVPVVMNPPAGRIWTANARVVGGTNYAKLGDGRYDTGARAGRIRDLLFAKHRFGPRDFLAIQLDDLGVRNRFWQQVMAAELAKRRDDPRFAAMIGPVANWGGRAVPGSVGYRLVAAFREAAVERFYRAFMGEPEKPRLSYAASQGEGSLRRLLRARPPALAPPGYASWTAFLSAALTEVAEEADEAGGVADFKWGGVSKAGVHHPLADAIPGLGWLTDPENVAVPGDASVVRAQWRRAGASERFVVSPGREHQGLFHMPGGQSGHPLAPYYLAGHEAWVEGRPTPFLPGRAKWVLTLAPPPPR